MPKPEYNAYTVRNYEKRGDDGRVYKESSWTRIGVAFPHQKGDGFDIVLEAFPVDGRITLRKPLPKEEAPAEAPAAE